MSIGFWQILIIVLLLVLLFGRGKISDLMGDVAQGIKSFKKGMTEDEEAEATSEDAKVIEHTPAEAAPKTEAKTATKSTAKSKTRAAPKSSATRKRKAS